MTPTTRKFHMTPRIRFILGLILAPAAIYLLGHATSSVSTSSTRHGPGPKPSFHPFIQEGEDGYGLRLIGEELDLGHTSDRWGLGKLGLGGNARPSILITGGAGQLGTLNSPFSRFTANLQAKHFYLDYQRLTPFIFSISSLVQPTSLPIMSSIIVARSSNPQTPFAPFFPPILSRVFSISPLYLWTPGVLQKSRIVQLSTKVESSQS